MHRLIIAFAVAATATPALAAPLPPASSTPPRPAEARCWGKACASVAFTDECTLVNNAKETVTVELSTGDAWRAAHPNEPTQIQITLKAGERHVQKADAGCHNPKNMFSWSAFFGEPKAPKQVTLYEVFGGPAQATCTGDACSAIALKDDDDCLMLQSKSEKEVTAELALKDGAKLTLALEGADAKKAAARESNSASAKRKAADRECGKVMASWRMIEDMRAQGTTIPKGDIDAKAAQCQAAAKTETASAGYHYSIFEPLTGSQYPVYRVRPTAKDGKCVARSNLTAYTATYAK